MAFRHPILPVFALLAIASASVAAGDEAKTDPKDKAKALVGKWTLVSISTDGRDLPVPPGSTLMEFREGGYTATSMPRPGTHEDGQWEVTEAGKLKITAIGSDGPAAVTEEDFTVDGDTLRISGKIAMPPPQLEAPMVMVLKRQP